jgi:signal peptidase I
MYNNIPQDDNSGNWLKRNAGEIFDWLKYIVLAFVIALILSNYVIVNAYVPSESMLSTIKPKTRILANRLHYYAKKPQRGDIVVFKYPDNEQTLFVKRVIGLPGETVEVKNGIVYIDGEKLSEPYIKQPSSNNFGPYKVPEGRYFMMGDNRNSSWDSRYWTNKYVEKSKILGKVFLVYFPEFKFFGL